MGIVVSRRNHIFIWKMSICSEINTTKSPEKSINTTNTSGCKSDLGLTRQRHLTTNYPVESSNKLSKSSLRKSSTCSFKPGKRFSLQVNGPSLLNDIDFIDHDDIISCHDLYNILNDGAMSSYIHDPYNIMIVDCRGKEFYDSNHVITAVHHVTLMGNNFLLTKFSVIILYSSELKKDSFSNQLIQFHDVIQEYVTCDVLVLKDGFTCFKSLYPFLCTKESKYSLTDRRALLIYPSVILDNQLYQGRGDQASNPVIIQFLSITHILNASTEHKNAFPSKIKYLKIALEDNSETNMFQHFYETSDFIHAAITTGGRVLVHCNQGISRSSTLTLAYLIRFKNLNLEIAFSTLKARRSCSCPNAGFLMQLSNWELEILGKRFTNIDAL